MKISINIADSVSFTSRGVEFTFDLTTVDKDKLSDFIAAAAVAGVSKAGVDAAASATKYGEENDMTPEEATEVLVGKRFKVWQTGEWSSRGAGGTGIDEFTRRMMAVVRPAVKAGDEAKYKNASPAERDAMCLEYLATVEDKKPDSYASIVKHVEAQMAAAAKEAEALKGLDIGL